MFRGIREPRQARPTPALSLADMPHETVDHRHGVDPYNTSGSFDRKNNWIRVGKR